MRVLYIGRDERFASALRERLVGEGPVDECSRVDPSDVEDRTGADAACLVVEDEPPAVDGVALARRLTGDHGDRPVVVLGRETGDDRHGSALEAGVADYLPAGAVSAALVAERVERAISDRVSGAADQTADDVLSRVTDGFFAVDGEWRFTYVNERAEELLERSESELIGRDLWEEFDAALDTTFQDEYERAMETGESVTFQEYYPPLSTWFEVRAYPSANGLSVYFQDITERKERERHLERYETIVETVGEGVYVLDEDSRFVMVNEAYCELVGYDREALLGTHSRDVTGVGIFEEASALAETLDADDAESAVLETDLETATGEVVPIRATISRFPFGDEYGRVGVVHDITAEKRYERTLAALQKATRRLLTDESPEAVAGNVLDTLVDVIGLPEGAVYLAEDDVLRPAVSSEGFARCFEGSVAGPLGPTDTSTTRRSFDTGATLTVEDGDASTDIDAPPASGLWIPLADHGVVVVTADEPAAFDDDDRKLAELLAATAEAALDRLARERDRQDRRRKLENLNDVVRRLLEAETREEICQRAVAAAQGTLDLPLTTIEHYDEERGALRPLARTDDVAALGDGPLFTSEENPVWQTYANDERAVYDDLLAATGLSEADTPIRSVIILPLGEHGVFVSGSTERGAFTEDDVALAEILAANTQAVLDRQDREQTLRDRTAALESRTESLQRLNRINDLIRTLTQHLIQASTRAEIDEAVVDQLVQADPYEFVWIGDRSVGSDTLEVRASAGRGTALLDAVSQIDVESSGETPPGLTALADDAITVEPSIHGSPPLSDWRQEALAAGFGSAIAVPLTYGDSTYGVLTVYAAERDAFSQIERTVLGELGEMIGYAINAVERKKALVSESTVELAFEITDPGVPAVAFVRETGASFEFEMLLSESDGSLRAFFTIRDADPDVVVEYAEAASGIEDVSYISERDGGHFFEAVVAQDGFLGTIVDHGARVTEMTAEGDSASVVVSLPQDGEINAFIDMFVSTYEGAELVARRERQQQVRTEAQFRRAYRERLTERQEEVTRTAYLSGFFEWPRESTGEEVAEALDVSQPTVNRHVRNAERALFDLVFDEE